RGYPGALVLSAERGIPPRPRRGTPLRQPGHPAHLALAQLSPAEKAAEEKAVTDAIERAVGEINFGPDGLVPAIAQQHDTGEVLMVAWMNRESVRLTLAEGRACYWSRARRALWRKGETSGQIQRLHELRLDCDGDTVLLLVDQQGVACHTGRRRCFFQAWRKAGWSVSAAPQLPP